MDEEQAAEVLMQTAGLALEVDEDAPSVEVGPLNWWFNAEFRQRASSAVDCGDVALQFPAEAREEFERVATWLLDNRTVAQAWEPRDLWTMLLSLVCALRQRSGAARESLAVSGVRRLLKPETSMIIQAVANARWSGPPMHFAGWLVSRVEDEGLPLLLKRAGLGPDVVETVLERVRSAGWPEGQVVVARVGLEHQSRAVERCDTMLQDFVAASLLLADPTLAGEQIRPNRVYEPGRWGLELDRNHFTQVEGQEHTHDYGSMTIEISKFGTHSSHRWHGDEPLELFDVASSCDPHLLERILWGTDEFSNRIRLGARWFAKSYWYAGLEDSTLALGVALDILLTGGKNMSTEAKRHVFAMLEPEPTVRAERRKQFSRFYGLRSAAAHGGDSRSVRDPENIEWQRAQLRWLVGQLAAFTSLEEVGPGPNDLSRALDDLRYGVVAWQRTDDSGRAAG